MPNIYSPAPVKLASVTEPVDGELRSVATVTAMTRTLADAIAFNDLTLAPLASIAALAAIVAPIDGQLRFVRGQGAYVFDSAAAFVLSPWTVLANDATPGAWVAADAHETARTTYVPCNQIHGISDGAQSEYNLANGDTVPVSSTSVGFGSGGGFLNKLFSTHATNTYGYAISLDRHLIHGATLSTATLRMGIGGMAGAPTVRSKVSIIRHERNFGWLGAVDWLYSVGNSFQYDVSAFTTYQPRNLVFTPDQNNVIDLALYSYTAMIGDMNGTNVVASMVAYHSIALAMTSIPDARR